MVSTTHLFAAAVLVATPCGELTLHRYEFTSVEMGVPFKLVFYAADEVVANTAKRAALDRVGQLNAAMSDYNPRSELTLLCRRSLPDRDIRVSRDLWTVLAASADLAERSDGAFDVTVGPLVRLWRRARRSRRLPSEDRLAEARRLVGYELLRLSPDSQSVRLGRAGMRLDLGAIAKGYAADAALLALRERGITRALVDAGGDVVLGEPPPGRAGWRVAVAARDAATDRPSRFLEIARCGVATSGDAFQFVEIGDRRYSHIVDPRTGIGLTTPMSVTVVAEDGMTADSLASAVCVLGHKQGLALVEMTPQAEAIFIWFERGQQRVAQSQGFRRFVVVPPDDDRPEKN